MRHHFTAWNCIQTNLACISALLQEAEAIADRKLDGIFTVWDEDRDGSIKFKQLQMRLQK